MGALNPWYREAAGTLSEAVLLYYLVERKTRGLPAPEGTDRGLAEETALSAGEVRSAWRQLQKRGLLRSDRSRRGRGLRLELTTSALL